MLRFQKSSFNPWPCSTIQQGTKYMAVFGVLLNIIVLALTILNLINYLNADTSHATNTIAIALYIVLIAVRQLEIVLGPILFLGAKQKKYGICKTWFQIEVAIFLLDVVIYTIYLGTTFTFLSFISILVVLLLRLYQMVVVYVFINNVQSELFFSDIQKEFDNPLSRPCRNNSNVGSFEESRQDPNFQQRDMYKI